MGRREPLDVSAIEQALHELPGWRHEGDALQKKYQFGDFREAVSFIVRLSFYAEELDHHPEIHNVYNRVELSLTTHDAGNKVTEMDLDLARSIEGFAWV